MCNLQKERYGQRKCFSWFPMIICILRVNYLLSARHFLVVPCETKLPNGALLVVVCLPGMIIRMSQYVMACVQHQGENVSDNG